MTNEQWMQLYLQAWHVVYNPEMGALHNGAKFWPWDEMWTTQGCGIDGYYMFSIRIFTWEPPVPGYVRYA